MIIGNGLIANAFYKYNSINNVILFASGVSNSSETKITSFNREKILLLNTIKSCNEKTLIYFSTCSIYDLDKSNSKYVQHKLEMEALIKEKCSKYYIFRLSNVVGKSNNLTLINYLFNAILNKKNMKINKHTSRNIVLIDDVFNIADEIIQKSIYLNETINIASGFNVPVTKIVKHIEDILETKALYDLVNIGSPFEIDISKIKNLKGATKIYNDNYIKNILIKYNKEYF